MAGLDLAAIREGICATIKAGLPRDVRAYPYPVGNPEIECVVVHPDTEYVDWYGSIAGGDGAMCVIRFVLEFMAPSRTTFEDGLRVLDEMLSAGVDLAVQADRTLGGTVDDALLGVSSGQTGIQPDATTGLPQAVLCRVPLTVWKQRS